MKSPYLRRVDIFFLKGIEVIKDFKVENDLKFALQFWKNRVECGKSGGREMDDFNSWGIRLTITWIKAMVMEVRRRKNI